MFEGKSIWEVFAMGGMTMYLLLIASAVSLGVILERLVDYYKKSRLSRIDFMKVIRQDIEGHNLEKAVKKCESEKSPIAAVVLAGLKNHKHEERIISNAMERETMIETVKLEKYTSIVGTIGNIAVYVGLFGTVLGIIRSFHNISMLGSGGISVIIGGVAESLICTATGLFVAIPSVVAYNYFTKRIDNFATEMEYCSSETLDLLTTGKKS
jgi:biopolymer transport protein ExbB